MGSGFRVRDVLTLLELGMEGSAGEQGARLQRGSGTELWLCGEPLGMLGSGVRGDERCVESLQARLALCSPHKQPGRESVCRTVRPRG